MTLNIVVAHSADDVNVAPDISLIRQEPPPLPIYGLRQSIQLFPRKLVVQLKVTHLLLSRLKVICTRRIASRLEITECGGHGGGGSGGPRAESCVRPV